MYMYVCARACAHVYVHTHVYVRVHIRMSRGQEDRTGPVVYVCVYVGFVCVHA